MDNSLPPERNLDALKIILMLVIIGIIGFTVYYVATSHSNAANTLAKSAASNPATPRQSLPHTNISFKVPELNIKLVDVPKGLQDLVYVTNTNTPQLATADFSTLRLSELDTHCSPVATVTVSDDGMLSRYSGSYDATHKPTPQITLAKQFSGYWIGFTPRTGTCSTDAATEILHDSQVDSFRALVSYPADIQPL